MAATPTASSLVACAAVSTSSERSELQSTAEQLLLEVEREAEDTGRISDDLISALLFVFQSPLQQAMDLLDRGSLTRYFCPAGRELYRVKGSGGRSYICLTSSNYCSCLSFVYTVLVKEESLFCKHMLAVQLGRAIGSGRRKHERNDGGNCSLPIVDEVCVSNEEFGRILACQGIDTDQDEDVHERTKD